MQFKRPLELLTVLSLFGTVSVHAQDAEPPVLTTVADVLALDGRDAEDTPCAVKLKGVVLGISTQFSFFSLNDATGTVGVIRRSQGLKQGDVVEVTGHTTTTSLSGHLYPRVVADSVTVTGTGPLPEPRTVTLRSFTSPPYYDQWVRLDAFVIGWEYRAPDLVVRLASADSYGEANITLTDPALLPQKLMGARLRLTAAVVSTPAAGRLLFVPDVAQIEMLEAGTDSSFDAPLVSARDVIQRKVESGRLWRVRGTYVARLDSRRIILTGADGAMLCYLQLPRGTETPGTIYGDAEPVSKLQPGDQVEAVGSIIESIRENTLSWCQIRVIGHEDPPEPESIDLITLKKLHNDDRWASIEGRVTFWTWANGRMTYTVTDGQASHELIVLNQPGTPFPTDLHDARMRFTGITGSIDPKASAVSFTIPNPAFVETSSRASPTRLISQSIP